MKKSSHLILEEKDHAPIKAWVKGVPFEESAQQQLKNIAKMPIIHSHIAVMPDVHMGKGDLGIIPSSMGRESYIVRGLGNPESFDSCSHGAGRVLSRTKAKQIYSIVDQIAATQGVECRKDKDVIDEIPYAYKDKVFTNKFKLRFDIFCHCKFLLTIFYTNLFSKNSG